MGIFGKLFEKRTEAPAEVAQATVECPHTVLIAHWDSAADMGDEAKAISFSCEACGAEFDPAEAQAHRDAAAERLKQITASSEEEAEAAPQDSGVR